MSHSCLPGTRLADAGRCMRVFVLIGLLCAPFSQASEQTPNPAVDELCASLLENFLSDSPSSFAEGLERNRLLLQPRQGLEDSAGLQHILMQKWAEALDPRYPRVSLLGKTAQQIKQHLDDNQVAYALADAQDSSLIEFPLVDDPRFPYNQFLHGVGKALGIKQFLYSLDLASPVAWFGLRNKEPAVFLSLFDMWSLKTNATLMDALVDAAIKNEKFVGAKTASIQGTSLITSSGSVGLDALTTEYVMSLQHVRDLKPESIATVLELLTETRDRITLFGEARKLEDIVFDHLFKEPPTTETWHRVTHLTYPRPWWLHGPERIGLSIRMIPNRNPELGKFAYEVEIGAFSGGPVETRTVLPGHLTYRLYERKRISNDELTASLFIRAAQANLRFYTPVFAGDELSQITRMLTDASVPTLSANERDALLHEVRELADARLRALGFTFDNQ